MALHDERKRLEALKVAVHRKLGPFGRLDAEQREWLAAWREDQPQPDYASMINSEDEIGEGIRGDIRRILYGDFPMILATDTEAEAGNKWTRYLGR